MRGQAVAEAAPPSDLEATNRHAGEVASARRTTRRRLQIVGCVLLVAVGFLVFKALTSAVTYFKTVDQALSSRASLGTSTFQLEGLVASRSIRHPNATTVSFAISGTRHDEIQITSHAEPPELFRAGIPVVLVGHFSPSSTHFVSDQILVKHSNNYIAQHPARVRASNGSVR